MIKTWSIKVNVFEIKRAKLNYIVFFVINVTMSYRMFTLLYFLDNVFKVNSNFLMLLPQIEFDPQLFLENTTTLTTVLCNRFLYKLG